MHEDEECMHRMEFNPSESSTDCIIAYSCRLLGD